MGYPEGRFSHNEAQMYSTIELRKQMTLNRQQTVRDEFRVLKVNKHVHECADDKFKVVPIYKVLNNNASLRGEKERYLINTSKPEFNYVYKVSISIHDC